MAKRSSASHLRENRNLRNNQAKKNTAGYLRRDPMLALAKISYFNGLACRGCYIGAAPLNCQVYRPISALPVIETGLSNTDQPVRGGSDMANIDRVVSRHLIGGRHAFCGRISGRCLVERM